MTTTKIVNLVIKSSSTHPHQGKLPKKETLLGAIGLAELARDFAKEGRVDEAMNIPVSQWDEVIKRLNTKLENYATT